MPLGHQLYTSIKLTCSYIFLSFSLKTKNKPPQISHPLSTTAPPHGIADVLEGGWLSYGTV